MKTHFYKYILFTLKVLALCNLKAYSQTLNPLKNYITYYGEHNAHINDNTLDSIEVTWLFSETISVNIDSFTYIYRLENLDETSPYYYEITTPVIKDSIPVDQIWDPVTNTLTYIYEYTYECYDKLAIINPFYTHEVVYDGEVFDKILGSGVNYYYDKFEFNDDYPEFWQAANNPALYTYNLVYDTLKYGNIESVPDYFAYKTTVNGAPDYNFAGYSIPGPYIHIFWDGYLSQQQQPPTEYLPTPTIFLPDSNIESSDTVLITYPDTIPEQFWFKTNSFRHKEVLYYPVYNQEICQGDLFTINGNVITESGLYLDSLTTTFGTDSLVGVNLIVKPFVYSDTVDMSICENSEGYVFGGTNYTESGLYNYSIGNNCDTVHFLNLSTIEIPNEIDQNNNVLTYLTPNNDYTYQWIDYTTGLPISGATLSTFSPSYNSSYVLEITFGGCTVTSNQIGTNIGLNDLEGYLTCTPNPFVNSIELSFGDYEHSGYFEVYDVNSKRLIKEEFISAVNFSLNTEHLPRGIYLIKINTEKGIYQKKMIK